MIFSIYGAPPPSRPQTRQGWFLYLLRKAAPTILLCGHGAHPQRSTTSPYQWQRAKERTGDGVEDRVCKFFFFLFHFYWLKSTMTMTGLWWWQRPKMTTKCANEGGLLAGSSNKIWKVFFFLSISFLLIKSMTTKNNDKVCERRLWNTGVVCITSRVLFKYVLLY